MLPPDLYGLQKNVFPSNFNRWKTASSSPRTLTGGKLPRLPKTAFFCWVIIDPCLITRWEIIDPFGTSVEIIEHKLTAFTLASICNSKKLLGIKRAATLLTPR